MKLKGSTLTTTYFGVVPILGGGIVFGAPTTPAAADGLPVNLEGTNGDFVLNYAILTATSITLYFNGSLATVGQQVPFKSVSLTNKTNPAQGTITVPAAAFGSVTTDGTNKLALANGYGFPSYATTGGDDVDFEIEFNNNVIGVITG